MFLTQVVIDANELSMMPISLTCCIRRRSDYIIGFAIPAIGPNKSKELTRIIALVHNIRVKI